MSLGSRQHCVPESNLLTSGVLELGEGVEREGWVGKARALRNRKA